MTDTMLSRFAAARRAYIARQFAHLNTMQQEAVLTTQGPLLLLAGAGSGKTTVLINRIANLIRFGCGSDSPLVPEWVTEEDTLFLENLPQNLSDAERERADKLCALDPVKPWNIIAVTFTNKAANEMKARLVAMLSPEADEIWAMTFHAACCRILRRDGQAIGLDRYFTIYDSTDSERVMKDVIRDMGLDDKLLPPKYVLGIISKEKDRMTTPEQLLRRAELTDDMRAIHVARAYERYQKRLLESNALDFDDIIVRTVELLQKCEDVRFYYQRKFRYVMVDEYQDTNHLQYLLTGLLAGGHENLCVVGDDDQSIYRFRGATIENILDFEKQYEGCRTIRLEQNYRSTQTILNAANAVIAHNRDRKGKRLWTENDPGEPVTVYEASDEMAEAEYVARTVMSDHAKKIPFQDHAVLYRTNAQSNALEQAFSRNGIPYRIIGGNRFFDRAEIKDMVAYLVLINNRADDFRLKRIINNPPRGLGAKSLESVERLAQAEGLPIYSVVRDAKNYAPLEKIAPKLQRFCDLIEGLAQLLETPISLPDFYDVLLERTGYVDMLRQKQTEENRSRLENVQELKSNIANYVRSVETPSLSGFLEEIALYTDIEQYNASDECVVMMTMHSSKGLEFPSVFLVGMEDGLFPGMRAIGDHTQMEEERRLCYVAITRAKKKLTLSHAHKRMLYGRTNSAIASRFLREIPEELVEKKGSYRTASYGDALARQADRPWADYTAYIAPAPKPSYSAQSVSRPAPLELSAGDMVSHTAFGRGMVLSVMKIANDALLEIAFDQIGTKKLMANTASAHMKKL